MVGQGVQESFNVKGGRNFISDIPLAARRTGALFTTIMIIDPRFNQLADGLCGFSTALKRGERVLIDAFDVPDAMVIALVQAARRRGALPYVQLHRPASPGN